MTHTIPSSVLRSKLTMVPGLRLVGKFAVGTDIANYRVRRRCCADEIRPLDFALRQSILLPLREELE